MNELSQKQSGPEKFPAPEILLPPDIRDSLAAFLRSRPEKLWFSIGFAGSPRMAAGRAAAEILGADLIVLDQEITRRDGRTPRRICMMMGEHEYRNQEYRLLLELDAESGGEKGTPASSRGKVVVCGDGILLDDRSFAFLKNRPVLWADGAPERLWLLAEAAEGTPDAPVYAFLSDPDREAARRKFRELYRMRRPLYEACADFTIFVP